MRHTPPDLEGILDELDGLRRDNERLQILVWDREANETALYEKLREAVQLELFWRRAAEQALRLWGSAQDEKDALRALAKRAAWKAYCYADVVIDEIGEDEDVEDDREWAEQLVGQLEEEKAP